MQFYLGTHMVSWLGRTDVPLFVSHRRLMKQASWPKVTGPWALDSGGFSEISIFGEFRTTPQEYAKRVGEYQDAIGHMDWAAPQDWMCEPWIIQQTGLSVLEHQQRTIDNYLELMSLGGPFIPVLQGWEQRDYFNHVAMYGKQGINLQQEPVVGVGSVCRRQNTREATDIFSSLSAAGLRLHGFGVKVTGYRVYGHYLHSADSMAWSFAARKRQIKLDGCTHARCNNCLIWALQWREKELGIDT